MCHTQFGDATLYTLRDTGAAQRIAVLTGSASLMAFLTRVMDTCIPSPRSTPRTMLWPASGITLWIAATICCSWESEITVKLYESVMPYLCRILNRVLLLMPSIDDIFVHESLRSLSG